MKKLIFLRNEEMKVKVPMTLLTEIEEEETHNKKEEKRKICTWRQKSVSKEVPGIGQGYHFLQVF